MGKFKRFMCRIFGQHWLNEGRTGKFCEERGLDGPRIESGLKAFVESDAGKVTMLALEDFKDHWTRQMRNLPLDDPAYNRKIQKMLVYISLPSWFKAFLLQLKGFQESEHDPAPEQEDLYL